MATPTFPASLPAPLISGYGYKDDVGNVSKTQKTFGYQTQKQIGNKPNTNFEIQFVFTQAEMKIFEDFYSDDLINGHKWFTMDLKIGSGYKNLYCRIIGKYSANLLSTTTWTTSMNIQVDSKTLITLSEYNALIA